MKLKLLHPFLDYKSVHVFTNKEPRRHVLLICQDGKQKGMSFARYAMCVKEGRLLDKTEVVDHIDGNQMHDCFENYQILTQSENSLKAKIQNGNLSLHNYYLCGCGKEFSRRVANCKSDSPGCSRSCSTKIQKGLLNKSTFIRQEKRSLEYSFKIQSLPYDEDNVTRFLESFKHIPESKPVKIKSKPVHIPPADSKPVVGYENIFHVTPKGEVFSLRRGRFISYCVNRHGEYTFTTRIGGHKGTCVAFRVSHVVAKAFIPNPEHKTKVHFIDGNKLNVAVENLQWV